MGIGLTVGKKHWEIGTADFFRSFLSTISYHLEPHGWGTQYPELMNDLFRDGILNYSSAPKALSDLHTIRQQLARYSPSQVVWNIDDLEAKPPWGDSISSDITDLSNYFITSDGNNLFQVLINAVHELCRQGGRLRID
jgi:hypothetical protein